MQLAANSWRSEMKVAAMERRRKTKDTSAGGALSDRSIGSHASGFSFEDSFPSACGHNTSRSGGTRKTAATIGVIAGEATRHFLVKKDSSWIPVLKTSLFSHTGERLPVPALQAVKGRRVRVVGATSVYPEGHFLAEDCMLDKYGTESEAARDFDTASCSSGLPSEDREKAFVMQRSLSTELLTDVVVLTSLNGDAAKVHKFMEHRSPRLRKSLDAALNALKSVEPELFAAAKLATQHLCTNLRILTYSEARDCVVCRIGVAKVALACGHVMCVDCAQDLVPCSSGKQCEIHPCPVCLTDLTLADARLILLEKYEDLKKSDPSRSSLLDSVPSSKRR